MLPTADSDHQPDIEELQSLRSDWSAFSRRRLVLWGVRWTIGFAIIGVVVYSNPEWSWLWWFGLGFALLTPITASIGQRIVSRKLREAEKSLAALEETI